MLRTGSGGGGGGGGGAVGLGEALENRVRPLVKGGALERLEGADGQTGGGKEGKNRERRRPLTDFAT